MHVTLINGATFLGSLAFGVMKDVLCLKLKIITFTLVVVVVQATFHSFPLKTHRHVDFVFIAAATNDSF